MIRGSESYPTQLCPGRHAAQDGLPEINSVISEEGNIVHAALYDPAKVALLASDQIEIVENMVRSRESLLAQIFAGVDLATLQVIKEELIYVTYNRKKIVSCHPDYIAIGIVSGRRIAFVPDYKGGFLEVPPPEINLQLRAYAVAVWQTYGVDEVYVTILPRFGKAKLPAAYSVEDLEQALEELHEINVESEAFNAKRIPSLDACRYCRARATTRCPETLREMDLMLSHNVLPAQLLPPDIAVWIEKAQSSMASAKKFLERVEKLITENPDAVPGYAMVPGVKKRIIEDPTAAFNAIRHLLDPEKDAEEFSAIVSVGIGDIEELIVAKLRAADPALKVKDAEKQAGDLLSDVIICKQNKPSLKAVKQLEGKAA